VRAILGYLAGFLVAGCSLLFVAALAPGLPWYALVFGAVFWVLVALRWRRRGMSETPDSDGSGPLWSPTRGGGL
jgi:ABC-type Fe3+-siderophore transport system permease subunit